MKQRIAKGNRLKRIDMKNLLAVILYLITFSASAGTYSIGYGSFKDISRESISYSNGSIYQIYRMDVIPEIGVVRFRDNPSGDTIDQVYITPTFHYRVNNFTFNGGVGVSWLDSRKLGGKELSTNFQFNDHIGISYRINNTASIEYRITHISNADIKKPNPGIDGHQVYLKIIH